MTPQASTTIRVSWHSPSKQYRKYVGFYLDEKGRRKPKCWYLGSDEQAALRLALQKKAEWQRLVDKGHDAWPNDKPRSRPKTTQRITIGAAANTYLDSLRRRAESGQVSWSYHEGEKANIDRALSALAAKTSIEAIDESHLERAVAAITSRPTVRPRKGQRQGLDSRISAQTALNTVKAMRRLFRWIDEDERFPWHRPRRFDSIFRVRRQHLLDEDERLREHQQLDEQQVDAFRLNELECIFRNATPRQALYVLLALNCGFTQSELSGLRDYEVNLDGDAPFIHRKRDKTGVQSRWTLWPEVVSLFRAEMSPPNGHRRVLLDDNGDTLIARANGSRRDHIHREWKALAKTIGRPHRLPFKHLRKTGADLAKKLGGLEVSEMYLSHREAAPMNGHYANRNWDALDAVLLQMREALLPSFGPWAVRSTR